MITHDDVLAHFQHELPPISLVSAYEDPALGLPDGGADVFIPDWHVLGPADAAQYPHSGFKQAEALEAFLFSLHRLKTAQHADGNKVRVWHMGDMVDEWRSLQPGDAGARIDGICGAFPNVFDLLTSSFPRGLGAEILAGNHDFQLFSLPQWRKARFRIVGDAAHGQMMVLHGDVFDWIEALPDDIQAAVVRLAKSYVSPTHDLSVQTQAEAVDKVNARLSRSDVPIAPPHPGLGVPAGDQPTGLAARNVIDGDRVKTKFWDPAKKLVKVLNEEGFSIRLMVIGHTHYARIARGAQAGGPFVLMDCGAWVDKCILPGETSPVLCAQFGVRIGNALRIYQVGHAAA